ncbi:lytic murein transglycosylase [Cellulomonas sp. SLBN-39]|uniref:lytic murein transglycosylase n=1 Tax=Cellulomonas sp. SLBN-39 TaxID=2768446 RepID=UPI001168A805|nr:lytic murein transglycosylase [Cellulomonas sp. SLBN-39]TQL01404.1 membrane-bound lytic murein transglycosylase B [Cellulomonas sp. SLBN-39]
MNAADSSPAQSSLAPPSPAPSSPARRPGRAGRRAWLATSLALALLGAAAVVGAAVTAADARTGAADAGAPTAGSTPGSMSGSAPGTASVAGPARTADDLPAGALADATWIATTAATTEVPERALRAYAGAALAVGASHPGCGLGWNGLAAVGLVESVHGTIDGGVLLDDGTSRPRVVGVPLDGDGVAAIGDTDGGRWDGDTTWDRAVGPLQVIPTTWVEHGTDGDGDGVADPFQVDDAALTAARYLCDAGGDLTTPEGWTAALAAYNADADYARRVTQAAQDYAQGRPATG